MSPFPAASVPPSVARPSRPVLRRPWLGCPAPSSRAVVALARSFSGLVGCFVRPSSRSFSGWVCVCSFASLAVARSLALAASSQFQLPFCLVRSVGGQFRVSVPCVPSAPFRLGLSRRLFRSCFPVVRVGRAAVVVLVALPAPVVSVLGSAAAVGFSGGRSVVLSSSLVSLVAAAVSSSASVSVGCARGVDAAFQAAFPGASVFRVAGRGRWAFVARSVACVRSVTVAGGVWVSFPAGPCPAGLVPSSSQSRCFCGAGSGSWASLALALGLGVRCLVWLPAGVAVPAGWGLSAVGAGWWVSGGSATQLSLF